MRQIIKWVTILLTFVGFVTLADTYSDRQFLHDSLIRLHVVGSTDKTEDQAVKLQVRDAVTAWIQTQMRGVETAEEARIFLRDHLEDLEQVANRTLEDSGFSDRASVSFLEEEFPVREYDTFSLPSGVYYSLRIRIGEGQGRNWWCVVFPSLCLGATTQQMQDTAASAGFEEDLTNALTGEDGYEYRFFLLDCLGMLENFFHMG